MQLRVDGPQAHYLIAVMRLSSNPILSSAAWLYTWAFTLPGFDLAEHIVLSAHLEFFLFLATLAGIPLLVERLLPKSRVRGAWAATFLFPGIFLYDSSLGVAADHVLAFWAVPIALTAFRFVRAWTPSRGVLLGAMLAGAALRWLA